MKKGFTLVELLVVITIIGILAGLALTGIQSSRKSARDGRRKADLEQVRSSLEMCRVDTGSYPTGPLYSGDNITCGGTTYMQIPDDPGTFRYYYRQVTATSYEICARLELGGTDSCGGGSSNCGSGGNACNYKTTQP